MYMYVCVWSVQVISMLSSVENNLWESVLSFFLSGTGLRLSVLLYIACTQWADLEKNDYKDSKVESNDSL